MISGALPPLSYSSVQPHGNASSLGAAEKSDGADKDTAHNTSAPHSTATDPHKPSSDAKQLDLSEQRMVTQLQQRDRAVRAHEAAHLAAAGSLAMGGANFTYQTGPDQQRYAIGGDVKIDASPVPGDPEATLAKSEQIRRAAMAPAQPSPQDVSVAADAGRMAAEARMEIMQQRLSPDEEEKGNGDAIASYQQNTSDSNESRLDTYA